MNERIEILMLEATYDKGGFDRHLFAEYIIQECIEVCKSRVGNSEYNTGRMHCASDIKEHFGIKE